MRGKTACFSGHRKIPLSSYCKLSQRLKDTIIQLIYEGYCFFGTGGALGFDTLAAKTILELRNDYTHIKLILVLPCISQPNKWSLQDKQVYEKIRSLADKTVYTSMDYTRDCMFKRNRHLVNNSSTCISYLEKETGGTAFTVNYAKKQGLRIINLA